MPNCRWSSAAWPGLEAQVAAIADDIAYDNHDIDDGLRAGLFTLEELLEVPLVARGWAAVRARYPERRRGAAGPRAGPRPDRAMVNDVLAETARRAPKGWARSTTVRAAGRALAGFSEAMAAEERALKAFLHARMYDAPEVQAVRAEAQHMLAALVRGLSRRSRLAAGRMAAGRGRSRSRWRARSATSSPA